MKKLLRILAAVLVCTLLGTSAAASSADYSDNLQEVKDTILQKVTESSGTSSVQDWLDNVLAANPGTGEEWYIIAMRQSDMELDYSVYRTALEKKVSEDRIVSATSRQRIALCFQAIGGGEDFVDSTLNDSIGKQGLMSWIYGLHLLKNGGKSDAVTEQEVLDRLLSEQKEDGGWSILGDYSDVDVTAMTISALAGYRDDPAVQEAIDKGFALLSEKQLDDAGYASMGISNPESALQVLCACSNNGIDALSDSRFVKSGRTIVDFVNDFRTAEGLYSHDKDGEYNAVATVQVFYCFTAYQRMQAGRSSFYVFEDPLTEVVRKSSPRINVKTLLMIVIIAALAAAIILNVKKGRKNYKNYLFPVIVAVIALLAVNFIKIEKTSDYYGSKTTAGDHPVTTYITIRCDTIKDEDKDYIPKDGIILDHTPIVIEDGSTAFDQLVSAVKEYSIQMENEGSSRQAYISGINYIYEFDFGDLSGWMFSVNGEFANVGCGEFKLHEGDEVQWLYTTNLGKDLGIEEF